MFDRLDHLKEIKLHNNAFSGPLPRSFGKAAVLGKHDAHCARSASSEVRNDYHWMKHC